MTENEEYETLNKMFGPLTFKDSGGLDSLESLEVPCPLCQDTFNLAIAFEIFLKHIFEVHNLVIGDVQKIAKLPEYIQFWRDKFQTHPIEEIIPSIKVECTTHKYFLLSDLLKEDKELRHKLQLEHVLEVQEVERTDNSFKRNCLFCRLHFEGTRPDFLHHLSTDHNLQLGNPQNLVFIEELVENINTQLEALKCIYCERTFTDRNVLKEHMRKKLHKRISRHNKAFDKYYVVNYLESDKKWRAIQKEDDDNVTDTPAEDDSNRDEEYSDWNEREDLISCLFCPKKENNINTLCLHMEADHDFDFVELTKDLDFYQKVKFVNYVRRQIHKNACFFCSFMGANENELQTHLFKEQHSVLPSVKTFDQPEFYFPTYENDAFLYLIDDVED